MNLGFDAATKGTPEMAFWPTAVSLLIYSHSPSELSLISTIVLMFAGSMTHLSMRQMKRLIERILERTSTRQGVKRGKKSVPMVKRVTDASKVARNILPNNPYVLIFVVACVEINFAGGIILFIVLVRRILNATNPEFPSIILVMLSLLYTFVILSAFIWHFGDSSSS